MPDDPKQHYSKIHTDRGISVRIPQLLSMERPGLHALPLLPVGLAVRWVRREGVWTPVWFTLVICHIVVSTVYVGPQIVFSLKYAFSDYSIMCTHKASPLNYVKGKYVFAGSVHGGNFLTPTFYVPVT